MVDESDSRTRRTVLKAAGSASILALAGCVGGSGAGTVTDTTADEAGHHDGTETGHHDEDTEHDEAGHHDETETGHDDGHGHGSSLPESPSHSATVTMKTTDSGQHFEPHVVWVEQGGTVTFELTSGAHTTTAYAPENDQPQRIPDAAEGWDSGTLTESGATFEQTFETPGVYDYYCIPHHGMGMIGSVIVGEPGTDGQPGLAEPQSELPADARSKITELNEMCMEVLGGGHDHS
ncbi:plastocyanin/azurin family copper-binding protein [Haloarchaeobius sp. TZWSO28]|uniref:plastocyanin/azurin family copper-binding protein n=1 Tax=Haloarchaeobius sp. TZWSO28 TaxID=3446119 RepID=UPI003EBCBAFA